MEKEDKFGDVVEVSMEKEEKLGDVVEDSMEPDLDNYQVIYFPLVPNDPKEA